VLLLLNLCAVLVGKLYVVGGSDSQMSLVSVEIFDFVSGSWSSGPSLSTPRANMGVAVIDWRLFAVGGFSGKAFLDNMEFLSDDGEQWCAYWPADVTVDDTDDHSVLSIVTDIPDSCSSSLREDPEEQIDGDCSC